MSDAMIQPVERTANPFVVRRTGAEEYQRRQQQERQGRRKRENDERREHPALSPRTCITSACHIDCRI